MHVILAYLRYNRIIYGLLILYLLAIVLNAIGFNIWLPSCMVTYFTGYECLGCGLNRAAIALFSGDITGALTYNPLIFIYLPLAVGWAGYDFYKFVQHTNLTAK